MPFANISTIQLTNLLTGPLALSLNLPDGGLVAARLEAGATFTLPPTVGLDMLNRCADFHTLIDSGQAAMTLGQGTGDIAGIPASNSALMMSTSANTFNGDGYLLTTTGMCVQSGVVECSLGPDGAGNFYGEVTFDKPMAEQEGGPYGVDYPGPPGNVYGAYTLYARLDQGPQPSSDGVGYTSLTNPLVAPGPSGLGMRLTVGSPGEMVMWMIVGPLA
tara:strand:- start:2309 stop:2962 length:654 start_codon:yes stop_codon:yes gene_type:complete